MTGGKTRFILIAALAALLVVPAQAKAPRPADEAAVRQIVAGIYAGYSKPHDVLWPESGDDRPSPGSEPFLDAVDGFAIPYSSDFLALIENWESRLGDELWNMNGFDWYCQCQDFDPASARLVSQQYVIQGGNRIDSRLRFAPAGGAGEKITLRFLRENDRWTIDDIIFAGGETARKGLQGDLADIAKQNRAQ